jgi:hypothetical protein
VSIIPSCTVFLPDALAGAARTFGTEPARQCSQPHVSAPKVKDFLLFIGQVASTGCGE